MCPPLFQQAIQAVCWGLRHDVQYTFFCRPTALSANSSIFYGCSPARPAVLLASDTTAGIQGATRQDTAVSMPLVANTWEAALMSHTDKRWVEYLLNVIHHGFHINLTSNPRCHSSRGNAPLVEANAAVVLAFIEAQTRAGHMAGPFHLSDCPGVVISQMAAIPKKSLEKWKVIFQSLGSAGPECE